MSSLAVDKAAGEALTAGSETVGALLAALRPSTAPFSSLRIVSTGLKLGLKPSTLRFTPSTSRLISSSSASRIASLNWCWNSPAIRRTLLVIWPSVRSAFGRSFGPMTMRATPPISITSPQLMSSIASRVPRSAA